ncbi:MAG: hypothetical protein IJO28_08660 [Oscillospiraceae bacterium]|nr:hypothetical protein [Oscillospiraceae bacterium]
MRLPRRRSAARNDTALGFCFAAKGEKCYASAFFLFNETVETYRLVIASQCAHWRGNPFPRHLKNAIARQGNLLDKLKFVLSAVG